MRRLLLFISMGGDRGPNCCFVLNINPGGVLLLKSNSTLTISPSAYFVLENGGDVVFESGARLILNNAVFETRAILLGSLAQWRASRAGGLVAMSAAHSPRSRYCR